MNKEDNPTGCSEDLPELGLFADNFDAIAALNMRDWVTAALEAKGGKFVGGGVGCGGSDLDIEVEGHLYNIYIRPILMADEKG